MTPSLITARHIGLAGAAVGALAGIAELLAGTTPWTGNKNDPVMLGWVTLVLAGLLGLAALATTLATTPDRRIGVALTFVLTGLLGLTTAGIAWVPAALAGLTAGTLMARAAAEQGPLWDVVRRNWLRMLLVTLALVYLGLGVTYLTPAGLLGAAGAVAVVSALAIRSRSTPLALGLLVCGALPFAIATFWSLVTPLTCILLITTGVWALRQPGHSPTITGTEGH